MRVGSCRSRHRAESRLYQRHLQLMQEAARRRLRARLAPGGGRVIGWSVAGFTVSRVQWGAAVVLLSSRRWRMGGGIPDPRLRAGASWPFLRMPTCPRHGLLITPA